MGEKKRIIIPGAIGIILTVCLHIIFKHYTQKKNKMKEKKQSESTDAESIQKKDGGLRLFERLFNRWTKWKIYKSNETYIEVTLCPPGFGNYEVNRDTVLVDIYVKTNKFTGLSKYKRVKKYR